MDVDEYIRRRRRSAVEDVVGTQRRSSVEVFLNRRRASVDQLAGGTRRRSSVVSINSLNDGAFSFRENSNLSLGRRQYSSEPLWENILDTIENKSDKKLKGNLLDKRSLYSIKNVHVAEQDLDFHSGPKFSALGDVINNIEQKRERDYIKKSQLIDNSHNQFSRAIMQHFYKAPAPKSHPGYGMPRPETSENNPFRLMMNNLNREPSIVNINNFPALDDPIRCKRENEFCEILGPSSCSNCIEKTNRSIADELQRVWFPKIDISRKRLVKPKLSKVLKEGHLLQVRKKKMNELQLPATISPMRRQETHLDKRKINSASTYKPKRKRSRGSIYSISSSYSSNLSAVPEEIPA